VVALAWFSAHSTAQPVEYFVSPGGAANGEGSRQRPLDLATTLSEKSPARPGDTVWLFGGVYAGAFTSYLTGTPKAPIVVRQASRERATLDGRGFRPHNDQDKLPGRLQPPRVSKSRDAGPVNFIGWFGGSGRSLIFSDSASCCNIATEPPKRTEQSHTGNPNPVAHQKCALQFEVRRRFNNRKDG
jgi:hypothetical protein